MITAPIVLFAYARPDHTRRTLEALAANQLAAKSDLIVYADAARTDREVEAVNAVRVLIRRISGFRSVTLIERNENYGLARNIIEGVSEVLSQHDCIIVLEDDMLTSPFFLDYMNEALDRFANDERVVSIHGYVFPVSGPLPEAFFLIGADCWGWATWRRGWACFNPDGSALLRELQQRKLERAFDYEGNYPYTQMLEDQIAGKNDSWAIRWYASAFLEERLTLYPGRSLVHNIGNDATGTHCALSSEMDTALSDTPIRLEDVALEPSTIARQEFVSFLKQQSYKGLTARIRRLLGWLAPRTAQ
jgi:hypothetical protein